MRISYSFSDYLSLIWQGFVGFIKRLLPFLFIYFSLYTPGLLLVFFISKLSAVLPQSVVSFIVAAYLCVMPSVPTAVYLRGCTSEKAEDMTPDLCFVVWAATVFIALKLF